MCSLRKLEMEIAQLPPDEAAIFLQEYGIAEPSLNRMIKLSYDLLGLESFFTVSFCSRVDLNRLIDSTENG